ncbi:hypothetical protein EIN_056590, partial [Entamoeba invadens IP1]|uniref:hypothetical protein n=1 Tax=Entamoeba invadens IP1 TaxID=370355 RepID=UPI0002C3D139
MSKIKHSKPDTVVLLDSPIAQQENTTVPDKQLTPHVSLSSSFTQVKPRPLTTLLQNGSRESLKETTTYFKAIKKQHFIDLQTSSSLLIWNKQQNNLIQKNKTVPDLDALLLETLKKPLSLPQEHMTPKSNPQTPRKRQVFPLCQPTKKRTFNSKTQLTDVFKPLAPPSWITDGEEPTRELLANNIELYSDIYFFLTNPKRWRKDVMYRELPYYARIQQIKVLACTWNVNQGVYTRDEVDRWTGNLKDDPDIVVVGMQELEMSVDAIITGSRYSEKSVIWQELLLSSLNRGKENYIELGYYQLCGVLIYIFHKKALTHVIQNVGYGDCRVGAMSGALANKGGVAYRMRIYDSDICFVMDVVT